MTNDRLLLGLKGTMSEFELTLIRKRMLEAAVAKARRGELRLPVPVGYVWSRDTGLIMDPDRRVQDAVRTVFRLFERLGTARQVLLHMRRESLLFPRQSYNCTIDCRHATAHRTASCKMLRRTNGMIIAFSNRLSSAFVGEATQCWIADSVPARLNSACESARPTRYGRALDAEVVPKSAGVDGP